VNLNGFALPVEELKGTNPVETLDLSGKFLWFLKKLTLGVASLVVNLGVASLVVIASLIASMARCDEN
jgi:hypothetical protein